MSINYEQSFIKDGIEINPGETVLCISSSNKSTRCRLGVFLGVNSSGTPVVKYPSKRFVYKSKTDYGYIPWTVITPLPLERIYSINHFKPVTFDE